MIKNIKGIFLFAMLIMFFVLIPIKNVSAIGIKDNQVVDKNKAWTIRFTKEVELNDLIKQEIIVIDSKGNKVDVQIKLGQDNKSILISPPANGYTSGESYTLKIGPKVHSKDGKELKQEIIMKYSIKEDVRINFDKYKYEHINQGKVYQLPRTIWGLADKKSSIELKVSWTPSTVDTSKIGTYTFDGTVRGYDEKVKLILNVRGNPLTTKEIVNKYGNAIVNIEAQDDERKLIRTGSGFVVDSNGTVVTNFHVIDGASYAKVKLKSGVEYEVDNVLNYDKREDIAILKLKNSTSNLPTVILGDPEHRLSEENVVAIGNPDGLSNSIFEGVKKYTLTDTEITQNDITPSVKVTPGSDGGAVFDKYGEVIGIADTTGFDASIFKVKLLLNADFNSISLKELNAPPLSENLPVPTGLKVWSSSSHKIYVQWDELKDVDGYHVYFSYDKDKWYYFLDNNGNKKLYYWDYGNDSADIRYLQPDQTVYIRVTSVKNGVESRVSDIVSKATKVDYFAYMSTVPQPYLEYTGYSESTSEPGLCRYSYPVEKLPNTFFEDYFSTLEKYGWKYSHTFTRDDGIKVAFFVKNDQQISIKVLDGELYITGNIH